MNINHSIAAIAALLAGVALAVGGVYVLAGTGWAMLAGAVPCFGTAGLIVKGSRHGT